MDSSYKELLEETLRKDIEREGIATVLTGPVLPLDKSYCLEWKEQQGHLQATSRTPFDQKEHHYRAIPLSFDLQQDRVFIHKLSDEIHKELFQIEGIASLQILFTERSHLFNNPERSSEIWTSDIDGERAHPVTQDGDYNVTPIPFFYPGHVLYVSYKDGHSKIYLHRPETAATTPFLSLRGNQLLPALSKDSSCIAFISDVAGRPDLFIQRLDAHHRPTGKAKQLFSKPFATQASPSFSPDATRLVFVSDMQGSPHLYLYDLRDRQGEVTLLTKNWKENTSPSWSFDGTKIAYSAKIDGVRQICLYDIATQQEIQLTKGPGMKENPQWAPNNRHLIYNTESEEECQLFLLDTAHPVPQAMTKGAKQRRFPVFAPRNIPNQK
jgi:TolB protein